MSPSLSLIIPANNEADHIERCLAAVLASDPLPQDAPAQIIVVPNGCTDETARIAHGFAPDFAARAWSLDVIDLPKGSKIAALNAGEAAARGPVLAYLDADVIVSPPLLTQTCERLAHGTAGYASGTVVLSHARSWATRAYGRFYLWTPFMRQVAPGCGYFAMTQAGRARWDAWPAIISDDTYARLSFAAPERHQVDARYEWPLVEGIANLIRVRRRQNAGVDEISAKFPELAENEAKERFALADVCRATLHTPLGFVIYGLVTLAVKLSPGRTNDWRRGR